jgi:hypothetical protein
MPCASRWECQGGWHSTLQHLATSCNNHDMYWRVSICHGNTVCQDTCHETITFTRHNLENALNSMRFFNNAACPAFLTFLSTFDVTCFNMFQHVRRVVSFCLVLDFWVQGLSPTWPDARMSPVELPTIQAASSCRAQVALDISTQSKFRKKIMHLGKADNVSHVLKHHKH